MGLLTAVTPGLNVVALITAGVGALTALLVGTEEGRNALLSMAEATKVLLQNLKELGDVISQLFGKKDLQEMMKDTINDIKEVIALINEIVKSLRDLMDKRTWNGSSGQPWYHVDWDQIWWYRMFKTGTLQQPTDANKKPENRGSLAPAIGGFEAPEAAWFRIAQESVKQGFPEDVQKDQLIAQQAMQISLDNIDTNISNLQPMVVA